MKSDIGSIRGSPAILPQGEPNWGSTRETSQEGGGDRAGEGCPGKGLALEVGLPGLDKFEKNLLIY